MALNTNLWKLKYISALENVRNKMAEYFSKKGETLNCNCVYIIGSHSSKPKPRPSYRYSTTACIEELISYRFSEHRRTIFQQHNVFRNTLGHFSIRRAHNAALLEGIGQPLVIKSVPTNKIKEGEVRVEVHCCSVNTSDVLFCKGLYEKPTTLPFFPGFEIAGEIIEVGSKVKDLAVGDRVIGLNKELFAGFAEQTVLPYKDVWKIGESIPFDKAAALVDSYATVLIGIKRANIEPDESVLVTAAAGGLGLAAVDIAASIYKAKVIGVCGSEENGSVVRDKGAFSAVNYHKTEVVKAVKKFAKGEGVKVIIDTIGGDVFTNCFQCISHEGRIVIAGFASKEIPHILTSQLISKSCSLFAVSLTNYRLVANETYRDTVEEVIEMYEEGDLDPDISATFPFSEINEAFKYLEGDLSVGKVVLKMK